jgi:drug/metabolite transporter (DMT)-like permease
MADKRRTLPDGTAIAMLHGAVMLFGLSGVIGRFVESSAIMTAWGRVLVSSALLLGYLTINKTPLALKSPRDTLRAMAGGALLAVHWTAFFQSVQMASVAIGTITFSTFPLFLIFLEPVIFREKFQKKNLASVAVILLGVIITIPEYSLSNTVTVGILWGMISSLIYALLALINRDLSSKYRGIQISFYEQATAGVVLLPLMLFTYKTPSVTDILGIAGIGIFCTAIGFSLYVTAQKSVSAQQAGIVSSMETVYGIVFAAIFLGEAPSPRELIGGAIILAVAVLASVQSGRSPRTDRTDATDKTDLTDGP